MAAAGDAEKPIFAFANSSRDTNIVIAKKYNEWASTVHGQDRLLDHWEKSGGHLYLFFHDFNGVGNKKMRGIARVCGRLSDSLKQALWDGGAYGPHWRIKWLTKESFDSKPFKGLNDMDLVLPSIAISMLQKMVRGDDDVQSLIDAAATAAAKQKGQRTITDFLTAS
jgi:hypothetical protein